jgi:hypothetical protein
MESRSTTARRWGPLLWEARRRLTVSYTSLPSAGSRRATSQMITPRCAAAARSWVARSVRLRASGSCMYPTFHLPITRPHRVIYSMTEVRDLQLARNDKAAASGLMTEARQSRNPAACAPSGAWVRNRGVHPSVDVGHFALATFPASNPPNVQVSRCDRTVRSHRSESALAHRQPTTTERRQRRPQPSRAGPPRRRKVK